MDLFFKFFVGQYFICGDMKFFVWRNALWKIKIRRWKLYAGKCALQVWTGKKIGKKCCCTSEKKLRRFNKFRFYDWKKSDQFGLQSIVLQACGNLCGEPIGLTKKRPIFEITTFKDTIQILQQYYYKILHHKQCYLFWKWERRAEQPSLNMQQ